MTTKVNSFIEKQLPTVAGIIKTNSLEIRSIGKAAYQESDEDGYPLAKRELTFRDKIAARGFELTPEQIEAANKEITAAKWPEEAVLNTIEQGGPLPDWFAEIWSNAAEDYKFVYRDTKGQILYLRARRDKKEGENGPDKTFPCVVPVRFDNGELIWIAGEPNTAHLFGLETLKDQVTAVIVEGERKALKVREIQAGETEKARSHPFRDYLSNAAVLSFSNGVHGAERADWSTIEDAGIQSVVIWPDCDEAGLSVVPKIAKAVSCRTTCVEVSPDIFPVGWDLADDVPHVEGVYCGPTALEMTFPCTWMTKQVPAPFGDDKTKIVTVLRDHAKSEYAYVTQIERFVHKATGRRYSKTGLDNRLAPFCDVKGVSSLLLRVFNGTIEAIGYRPDKKSLTRYNEAGISKFNVYRPTTIERAAGEIEPWTEFLTYMFPGDRDRKNVERWIATLIARPEVRLKFGLLLISIKQGVGKGILCRDVLARLVGDHNVSFPTPGSIESQFNEWQFAKRLAIVDELYTEGSWKFYNRIKATLTEKTCEINSKGDKQFTADNYITAIACSNSLAAMGLEDGDRRWLVPEITENPWPKEKFAEFLFWLDTKKGLEAIHAWAIQYVNTFDNGDIAPMSERKRRIISESIPEGQQDLQSLFEAMAADTKPRVWADNAAKSHFELSAKPATIRDWATRAGLSILPRSTIFNISQQAILNTPAKIEYDANDKSKDVINKYFLHPPAGNAILNDDGKIAA